MSDYKVGIFDSISFAYFLSSGFAKFKPLWIYCVRENCYFAMFNGAFPPAINCGGFTAGEPVCGEELARDTEYGAKETTFRICLMVVSNPLLDSGEHRQKAHVAVHEPVQVTMDYIVAAFSKDSEHRPQVL